MDERDAVMCFPVDEIYEKNKWYLMDDAVWFPVETDRDREI